MLAKEPEVIHKDEGISPKSPIIRLSYTWVGHLLMGRKIKNANKGNKL